MLKPDVDFNNHDTPSDFELQSAYEEQCRKTAELAEEIAELTALNEDLAFKLARIWANPFWKLSTPFRAIFHFLNRQFQRIRNTGSLRGLLAKIRGKLRERKVKARFGTDSFPDATERNRQTAAEFPVKIKFSILSPLYNTPAHFLRQMIESVLSQTYGEWELCLADGSEASAPKETEKICLSYAEKDERIKYHKLEKNGGISTNTNACYEMAGGDYIALLDHDDILHPSALFLYAQAINEQGADFLYSDEATFKKNDINRMITLHFKPDFAIDNLRANNYICHFCAFSRKLIEGEEMFRERFDGSQDHDLFLRLTAKAKKIVHIPQILYYWRSHRDSAAADIGAKPYAVAAAKAAVSAHLASQGFEGFRVTSTRAYENIFKISYQVIGAPKITIVILNRDHAADLKRLIQSIVDKSTYNNYEIIIVENNSTSPEIFACYDEIRETSRIRILEYPEKGLPFNFSALNNYGASHATGEYLLLLNNDTEVIRINWLEEMLMYAQRADVGAVGAKLYYEDKTIQHAGIVLGLGAHRSAGHSHYRISRENLGYMGRLCYAQNVSAVTGACLMVKKRLYDEVGGLDEEFAVSLNDVDFCLKLRKAGYLNVFTPFAELYHYESHSRGSDAGGENLLRYNDEVKRFRQKWSEVLDAGDPYYNPNFSLDHSDFSLAAAHTQPKSK